MALDPKLRKKLEEQTDEIMRSTIGDEAFAEFKRRRHLNQVCYKCPYMCHDGDTLDVCDPPSEFECMRAREEELMQQ